MTWGEAYLAQLKRDVEAKRAKQAAAQPAMSDVDRLSLAEHLDILRIKGVTLN